MQGGNTNGKHSSRSRPLEAADAAQTGVQDDIIAVEPCDEFDVQPDSKPGRAAGSHRFGRPAGIAACVLEVCHPHVTAQSHGSNPGRGRVIVSHWMGGVRTDPWP